MKKELLNLTGKIDTKTVSTLTTVHQIAVALGHSYIVVGATARDLVLHYGYGAPVERATRDIDFAIEVESWAAFEKMKSELVQQGFQVDKRTEHRLTSPTGHPIDIVPFGGVEQANSTIAWPPDGDVEMSVTGFKEANDNAQLVLISENPEIKCRVATPAGLMILKLISWTDRANELRVKDAGDIRYLLTTYPQIEAVQDEVYSDVNESTLQKYGWNPDLTACCLLGEECRRISSAQTAEQIVTLKDTDSQKNTERIAIEMADGDAE